MRHAEPPGRPLVQVLAAIAVALSLLSPRAALAGTLTAGPYSLSTSSVTATWTSTYGAGTTYTATLSSGPLPNSYTGNQSSNTLNLFAGFTGLTPATMYDVSVSTLNGAAIDLGVTATYAVVPGPAVGYSTFSAVSTTTLTVSWSSGTAATGYNPAGTSYQLVFSTSSSYTPTAGSVVVTSTYATSSGPPDNTSLYFEVQAGNPVPVLTAFEVLGGTVIPAAPPTTVAFDEIFSSSITVSAYAPGSAFSNLDVGSSAINVAKGGVYNGFQSGNVWASKTSMPTARQYAAAVAYAGKIYVLGGQNGSALATNEQYDPVTDSWSTKASMPTARYGLTAVAVNGKIYAIGGNSGSGVLATNEQYDPATDSWSTKAAMPTARDSLSAAAYNGYIYAVGGKSGASLSAHERYDPSADSWSSLSALPATRDSAVEAVINGVLYVVGGEQNGSAISTNEKYSFAGDSWSSAVSMPSALIAPAAAVVGSKIYVVGGDLGGGVGLSSATEVYDGNSDLWTSRANMISARKGLAAAAAGGKIFALGGSNGSSALATDERYDVGVAAQFGGLTPNTQYSFKAQARDQVGTLTAESPVVSTYTAAAAPAAPVSVATFTSVTATGFTLSWSSGASSAGFNPSGTQYLSQLSASSSFGAIAASSSTYNTAAAFSGLSANATYYAEVEAFNAYGAATPFTSFGSTVTPAVAPGGPVGVATFTSVTTTGLTVSWSSGTAAGGYDSSGTTYVVQLSTMASFTPLWSSSQTTATSAAFTGLDNGTTYYAQVEAVDRSGAATAFLNLGSTETTVGLAAAGFSGLSATGTTVNWTTGFSAGTSYVAQLSTGAFPNAFSGNLSSATFNTYASFAGLLGAATYYAQAATDSVHGPFYALGSTVTLPAAPGPASSTFSFVAATSLTLGWSSGTAAGGYNAGNAALFAAQLSTASGFGALTASSQTYNLTAGLTGLSPNTTYYARVQASNAAGAASGFVSYGSTVTAAVAPGAAVSTFTAVSSSGLTLNWSSGTAAGGYDPAGTTFVAVLSTSPTFNPVLASSQTLNLSASFTGLTADATYYGEVQAVNAAGAGTAFAALGSTVTTAALPGAAAFASVGASGLTASWTSGGDAAGTTFYAQISTASGFSPIVASSATFGVAATFSGLDPNATYYARVAAYDVAAGTWTAYTALGSTITLAAAPGAPVGTAAFTTVGYSSFTVNWSSGSAGVYDPAGTAYLCEVSTSAGFSAILASSQTAGLSAVFSSSIAGDTTHYARVRAFNAANTATSATSLGSISTLAQQPQGGAFSAVTTSGLSVSFSAPSDPSGTTYYIQLSTAASFSPVLASSQTFNQSASFAGLSLNATYYAQAAAFDVAQATWTGFASLGSTITLAAAPGQPAGSTFTAVYVSSLTVQWSSGGDPAGTYYVVQLATSAGFTTIAASSQTLGLAATFTALSSSATYFAQVQALNGGGTPTAFTSLGSTRTQIGALGFNGFSTVTASSMTVTWLTGFGAGTTYYAVLSTGALPNSFSGNASSNTLNLYASFTGLTPDTAYYTEVATAAAGPFTTLASTYTLAVAPGAVSPAFSSVSAAVLTVAWSSGTSAGGYDPLNSTLYVVQLSTVGSFSALTASSQTYNLAATFAGLSANTTYFAEVDAVSGSGAPSAFLNIGSTMTAAAAATAASPEFSGVSTAAATLAWSANGNPAGTTYDAVLSTSASYSPAAASSQTLNTTASFSSLSPNTTYYPSVAAFDVRSGTWTSFTLFLPTATLAAAPAAAGGGTFALVASSGMAVSWSANGNPSGTTYVLQLATSAAFSTVTASSSTASSTASISGLSPNATYYARVEALNWGNTPSAFTTLGSTMTSAASPGVAAVSAVSGAGLTLNWTAAGNPSGTQYLAEISTNAGFAPITASSSTYNLGAAFSGLTPDVVYYGQVLAYNGAGTATPFVSLGSTVTTAAAPSSPSFSAVAATGLTASWTSSDVSGTTYYVQLALSAGFSPVAASSQTAGLSASFASLAPNAAYWARVAAYDVAAGTWTAFSGAASTTTLATAPGSAASTFTSVSINALTVNWSSGTAGVFDPAGTAYVAQLSTAPGFSPVLASSQTYNLFAAFSGLNGGATYYAQVQAINASSAATSFTALGSTITPTGPPSTVSPSFSAVTSAGVTASWSGNSPAGTTYYAQISTSASFSPVLFSSQTLSQAASFSGLSANVTYFVQAAAYDYAAATWTAFTPLGSTSTLAAAPGQPASTFTSVSGAGFTLNWTANGNAAGTLYLAQLSASAGFGVLAASSQTFNTSADFSGLSANGTYYAQVEAVNNNGVPTAFTNVGSTITPIAAPAAPVGVSSFTSVTANSVVVNWSSGTAAAGYDAVGTQYVVQLSTMAGFSPLWASSQTANTSASFTGLNYNTTYYAQVEALAASGAATPFTSLGSTLTLLGLSPAGFAAVDAASVTVSFTTSFSSGTLYIIQASTGAFPNAFSGNASSSTFNLAATFNGLAPNATYYVQGATAAAGPFYALGSTMTLANAPAAAAAAFSGVGANGLTAAWTANGDPSGTTYVARISTTAGFSPVAASSTTPGVSAGFTGLTPNTTYFAQAQAVNGQNVPTAFLAIGSTITLAAAPGAPAGSTFTAVGGNTLTLSWSSSDPSGTSYLAQLSTSAGFSPLAASSQTYNLFATFSGLNPNAVYYAQVRAANGAGTATAFTSFGSTATPTATPGAAASTFTAVSTSGLTVNWASNGNPAGTTYYAQLAVDAGFASVVASSQTLNVSAAFSALSPNVLYYARAAAFSLNASTWTAFASLGSTATLANPPSAPALVEVDLSSVAFSWSASGDPAGTTYYAQISTDNFATVDASSLTLNLSAAFTSLQSNATYYLRVAALSGAGALTSYATLPATWTLVAAPVAAGAATVGASSATIAWGANGDAAGTLFAAQISSDNFVSVNASSATRNAFATFSGLAANTTYYFRAQAFANGGAATAFTALPAALTSLLSPAAGASPFSPAGATTLTAAWASGGNGAGTTYVAQLSTDNFASVSLASSTLNLAASFAGLTPNTTYFARVEAAGGGNTSAFVSLGSTVTLAQPPTGTAVSAVFAASATISWALNGNPAATVAEVQTSLDGATFASVFTGAATSVVDSGLLGCTTYWVRVRDRNFAGTLTAFDSTVQFTTAGSTPAAASGLTAAPVAGNKIFLSWTPSPSPGVTAYDLFWDNGTGAVSFGAPLASLTTAQTTFTTGVLASSAAYTFALRAKNSCGIEETAGVFASSPSTTTLSAVSAFIKAPESGKHVTGNSLTLVADIAQGTPDQAASVLFQYRPSGSGAWLDVVSANVNHPNPALSYPFFIQWNVTGSGLTPGASYDVRAVAVSVLGSTDTAPSAVTLVYDPTPSADITENLVSGQVQKQQVLNNAVTSRFEAAGWGATDPAISVVLPAGALSDSTVTVTVSANPTITTGPPSGFALVGSAVQIDLGNGQHLLGGGLSALVTLTYPNTTTTNSNLQVYSLDLLTGVWTAVPSSVDATSHTVSGLTPHFSIFAVVAGAAAASTLDGVRVYPNPYKPNGGNPDEGKPYSAGDPTSGVIFDRLPQGSTIKIYNLSGQLVASMDGSAGGAVRWDARNNGGRAVASGMYFAVVSCEGFKSVVKKVAIIR